MSSQPTPRSHEPVAAHRWRAAAAWNDALARSLERFATLVGEDPALEREFAGSLAAFGEPGEGPERALAERRHLEWFVCERPSDRLEGVPAEALREAWEERAVELDDEDPLAAHALCDAFLGSVASAFEITAVEPDGSILVRDVFGLAEYELLEPEAAGELMDGDLLVGRIFPVGDELHRLSPATGCFRDRALVAALRGDVESMRTTHGHLLRMQQSELEALFFQRHRGSRVDAAGSLEGARRKARAELCAAGLEPARASATVDAVCAQARAGAGGAPAVTEILDVLAFETEVELGTARRVVAELWSVASPAAEPEGASAPGSAQAPATASARGARRAVPDGAQPSSSAAAEALRRFDEGRAQGEDLEQLFRRLERELGVGEEEVEDQEHSPDFPGVVGAMVEEYLWDREREEGPAQRGSRELLRELSRYGEGIGVFENLGPRDLLDFAGRWLLEESSVREEERARALLDALADFCRWCEERHALELWSGFAATWETLAADVPRLVTLGAALADGLRPEAGAYRVLGASGAALRLVDEDGEERELQIAQSELSERLRPGDLLRLAVRPEGTHVVRVYPGVLRTLVGQVDDTLD